MPRFNSARDIRFFQQISTELVNDVIERQDTETNYEGFGPDASRTTNFRFNRHTLIEADFYPEVGDIISLDGSYYEVSNVTEDQWVGGQSESKFSVICEAFITRNSGINLEERVR